MRDWGVSFSAPMVLALLDDRKTQTRRLAWKAERPTRLAARLAAVQAGDTLWVREEWALSGEWAAARSSALARPNDPEDLTRHHRIYRASADGYDDAAQQWRQPRPILTSSYHESERPPCALAPGPTSIATAARCPAWSAAPATGSASSRSPTRRRT